MRIAWFFHALDSERGREIYDELLHAAVEAGFPARPQVTRVPLKTWEDATLRKLRDYCIANPSAAVLYTHTKGAYRDEYLVDKTTGKAAARSWDSLWREGMIDRLIRAWPSRLQDLESYDITGMHWIEAAADSYFAGNFWWARASYIAKLPELPSLNYITRYQAQKWVASGSPRVKALSSGRESIPFPQTPNPATRIVATSAEEAEARFLANTLL